MAKAPHLAARRWLPAGLPPADQTGGGASVCLPPRTLTAVIAESDLCLCTADLQAVIGPGPLVVCGLTASVGPARNHPSERITIK